MADSQLPKNEILELIGAIVLSTQNAERCLKTILPFTDSVDPTANGALSRHDKLKRRSLGDLIGKFVDASTSDSAQLSVYLDQIVNDRNNIVHHFAETYGHLLRSGETHQVILSLRLHLAKTNALLHALQQAALQLFEAMRDTTFHGTPEYEEMAATCASLREQLQANNSFKPKPLRGSA